MLRLRENFGPRSSRSAQDDRWRRLHSRSGRRYPRCHSERSEESAFRETADSSGLKSLGMTRVQGRESARLKPCPFYDPQRDERGRGRPRHMAATTRPEGEFPEARLLIGRTSRCFDYARTSVPEVLAPLRMTVWRRLRSRSARGRGRPRVARAFFPAPVVAA